jgi:predicted alpha/beta hydrolase family esterase
MRTSDVDILMIPGWAGSGPDHWQSRWEAKLSTARRVQQEDWHKPHRAQWAANIVAAVAASSRPVVLVAHSAGVSSVAHAFAGRPVEVAGRVVGAFLVAAPSERALHAIPGMPADFAAHAREKLPFRSVLAASETDPYCTYDEAQELAGAWGAEISNAGDAGHINAASGHGPWPEGLMRFAGFMRSLG